MANSRRSVDRSIDRSIDPRIHDCVGFVIGVRAFQSRITMRNQRGDSPRLLAGRLSRRGAALVFCPRSPSPHKSARYHRTEEAEGWEGGGEEEDAERSIRGIEPSFEPSDQRDSPIFPPSVPSGCFLPPTPHPPHALPDRSFSLSSVHCSCRSCRS
jgi:hypothetical protein